MEPAAVPAGVPGRAASGSAARTAPPPLANASVVRKSTFSGVNSAQKRPLSWDPAFLCHSGDQQGARRQAGSVPCAWWHRPPP